MSISADAQTKRISHTGHGPEVHFGDSKPFPDRIADVQGPTLPFSAIPAKHHVRRSVLGLRLFEAGEVDVAAAVAGDELIIGYECKAMNCCIAGKCRDECSGAYVPHLQRFVPGGGDGAPPIRAHRHASDPRRMALESAEFAPCLQVPHLQRPVLTGANDAA
jgi:hypothetical protein